KPRSGDKWSRLTVRGILSNPTYYGVVKWQERAEIKSLVDGQVVISRPYNPEPILIPGLHEPIISKEVYDKAQQVRIANTIPKSKKSTGPKNPLAGLIVCGKCGKKMQRQAQKGKVWLHCEGQYCNNCASYLDVVETSLMYALEKWFAGYKLTITDDDAPSPTEDIKVAIKRQEEDLKLLDKQVEKLHDLLEREIYDVDTFLERNQNLADRKKDINKSIALLKKELTSAGVAISRVEFVPRMQRVLDVYESLEDPQAKNQLLRSVLDKVIYTKEKAGKDYVTSFDLEIYPFVKF
ncbi:MAG: recombinase family protein, partial [Eubacteriales bacterium]|nr:recombinase family protein [Eubacteriales bacterium]